MDARIDDFIAVQNNESKTIGLILPLSNNIFYDELALGMEDAVTSLGFQLLTGFSREDEAREAQLVATMRDSNLRAICVVAVGSEDDRFGSFVESKVGVAFQLQTSPIADSCSIAIDQVYGGYLGIEYLHSLGHKNILWVSGPSHHHQSNQRFVGITQAANDLGVQISTLIAPSLDFLSGENIAPTIISANPLPDAIFAANDTVALGIMNYFYKSNIQIPTDISILGYDNITYAESALIPLSTVTQTPYKIGYMRGEQLIADLSASADHVHSHVSVRPQIVERDSTAPRK